MNVNQCPFKLGSISKVGSFSYPISEQGRGEKVGFLKFGTYVDRVCNPTREFAL